MIHMQGSLLSKLYWSLTPLIDAQFSSPPNAIEQVLTQYWLTGKMTFSTALLEQGTKFQQQVWQSLCLIPLGHTRTYGELAKALGTSPRALANACRKNPFPVMIPCHRVLAKTSIGGYAGATTGKLIAIKSALLKHESRVIDKFQATY